MKSSINLASQKKEMTTHVVRRLFLYSIVIFSAAFLFALSLLSYNFFLKSQLASAQGESDKIKQQIATLSTTEAKVVALRERLVLADKLLTTRSDLGSKIVSIINVIPQSITINSIDAGEKSFGLQVSSRNLFALNSLVEEGVGSLVKNKSYGITKADLSSFKVDTKNGNYILSLQLYFDVKKPQPLLQKPITIK